MEISISPRESIPIITSEGRFNGLSGSEFNKKVLDLIEQGPTIILDFSGVVYLSNSGIRSLLKLKQQLRARSGDTCW